MNPSRSVRSELVTAIAIHGMLGDVYMGEKSAGPPSAPTRKDCAACATTQRRVAERFRFPRLYCDAGPRSAAWYSRSLSRLRWSKTMVALPMPGQ